MTEVSRKSHKSRVGEVVNTFEWLVTAFVLAFLFRAFVMEAFRIPTGSMADTLKGAHFRLRCRQCGYRYDHGFIPRQYNQPEDVVPRRMMELPPTKCPSCGYFQGRRGYSTVANGDRILVLKCIYQFSEPARWDVIVFRNPLEPHINYIKRLIALPGETVEIIDGDVYIDGLIARKPPGAQDELWMPIYDGDYQPVRPREGLFNGHPWSCPLVNAENSTWKRSGSIFSLDSGGRGANYLWYDTSVGNDFKATYAYNSPGFYAKMPICSDLMVRFSATFGDDGQVGVVLGKYGRLYRGWVDSKGRMSIEAQEDGRNRTLASTSVSPPDQGGFVPIRFANVDHKLVLDFGGRRLSYCLGTGPEDAGPIRPDIEPVAGIFGSGRLSLRHMAIFRDTFYTGRSMGEEGSPGRASQGNQFTLASDEFFVLGDNSPNSQDGRWWDREGIGNGGNTIRPGIVPRDYLVGKALFVYWPSWFRPVGRLSFLFVPNFGQMRFINGGQRGDIESGSESVSPSQSQAK